MSNKLGFSGSLAKRFQDNALTPLLAATALLLGLFAVAITPREEEPQIDVTLANVFVPFPGASTSEVENLVADFETAEIDRALADFLEDQPNPAFFRRTVGDRQRNALAVFADPQHDELPGAALARDQRRQDAQVLDPFAQHALA